MMLATTTPAGLPSEVQHKSLISWQSIKALECFVSGRSCETNLLFAVPIKDHTKQYIPLILHQSLTCLLPSDSSK